MESPVILHIPHSSTVIPNDIRPKILLSDTELNTELAFLTDAFTDQLFYHQRFKEDTIIFPISRIIVDPERLIDDEKEIMSKIGMGVIYLKSTKGKQLRTQLTASARRELLEKYYIPHHNRFTEFVDARTNKYGKCLIIDCHSFPSFVPYPLEIDISECRPDFCIGTDKFHTPDWLINSLVKLLEAEDYYTEINLPFSGSIIPEKYYHKNSNVLSIMIEVNRKLYMDEESIEKNNNYEKIQNTIHKIISKLHKLVDNQLLR